MVRNEVKKNAIYGIKMCVSGLDFLPSFPRDQKIRRSIHTFVLSLRRDSVRRSTRDGLFFVCESSRKMGDTDHFLFFVLSFLSTLPPKYPFTSPCSHQPEPRRVIHQHTHTHPLEARMLQDSLPDPEIGTFAQSSTKDEHDGALDHHGVVPQVG